MLGILLVHSAKTRPVTLGIVPVVYAAGPEEPSHVVRKPLFMPLAESTPEPAITSSTARIERSAVAGTLKKELPDGLIPLPSDLSLSVDDGGEAHPVFLPVQLARVEGALDTKVDLPEPSVGRPTESTTGDRAPQSSRGWERSIGQSYPACDSELSGAGKNCSCRRSRNAARHNQ